MAFIPNDVIKKLTFEELTTDSMEIIMVII